MAISAITKTSQGGYPMLKRCTAKVGSYYNCIVFFSDQNKGTVVWAPEEKKEKLGHISTSWVSSHFERWVGTIEITE